MAGDYSKSSVLAELARAEANTRAVANVYSRREFDAFADKYGLTDRQALNVLGGGGVNVSPSTAGSAALSGVGQWVSDSLDDRHESKFKNILGSLAFPIYSLSDKLISEPIQSLWRKFKGTGVGKAVTNKAHEAIKPVDAWADKQTGVIKYPYQFARGIVGSEALRGSVLSMGSYEALKHTPELITKLAPSTASTFATGGKILGTATTGLSHAVPAAQYVYNTLSEGADEWSGEAAARRAQAAQDTLGPNATPLQAAIRAGVDRELDFLSGGGKKAAWILSYFAPPGWSQGLRAGVAALGGPREEKVRDLGTVRDLLATAKMYIKDPEAAKYFQRYMSAYKNRGKHTGYGNAALKLLSDGAFEADLDAETRAIEREMNQGVSPGNYVALQRVLTPSSPLKAARTRAYIAAEAARRLRQRRNAK